MRRAREPSADLIGLPTRDAARLRGWEGRGGFVDVSNARRALLLGPGPSRRDYDYGVTLTDANDLTEYDVLFIFPTFNAVMKGATHWGVHEGPTPVDVKLLDRRYAELRRFLQRGGVAVCFLGPPSIITPGGPYYALRFVIDGHDVQEMGIEVRSGTTIEVLDTDHVLTEYLRSGLTWMVTMKHGVLADAPFRSPIALSREGQIVAYEEIVDGGVLLWVPPPIRDEQWTLLLDASFRLWETRGELGPAMAEDERAAAELARLEQDYRERRGAMIEEIRRRHAERRRFADADPAVTRARTLHRSAGA